MQYYCLLFYYEQLPCARTQMFVFPFVFMCEALLNTGIHFNSYIIYLFVFTDSKYLLRLRKIHISLKKQISHKQSHKQEFFREQ